MISKDGRGRLNRQNIRCQASSVNFVEAGEAPALQHKQLVRLSVGSIHLLALFQKCDDVQQLLPGHSLVEALGHEGNWNRGY